MGRAKNEPQKQTRTPSRSFLKNSSAQVMVPRLMVILSAAALLVLGLVTVFSASSITGFIEQGNALSDISDQVIYTVGGVIFCVLIVLFCSQESLRGRVGTIFYAVCMLFLVLVPLVGTESLGAKRWISLGFFSFQPSEFAKIAICLMAARIVCDRNDGLITNDKEFGIKLVIYIGIPLALILSTQSDLGTTAICLVAVLSVLWLGGTKTRVILFLIGFILVVGFAAIFAQSYRASRMMIFLNPWADAGGDGYQLIHSFKAFASGGLIGAGIGKSYERLYLPEAETDFIFSVLGEEMGLIGTIGVVVIFLIFLRGGLMIAQQATSNYGLIVAGSLTTMIVAQAFVNILCVIGVFPITGKPLPFLSAGGSSLLSSLMIAGIIVSISFDSGKTNKYKERRNNLRVISAYSQSSGRDNSSRRGEYSFPRQYSVRNASNQRENVIPLQMQDFAARSSSLHRVRNTTGRR